MAKRKQQDNHGGPSKKPKTLHAEEHQIVSSAGLIPVDELFKGQATVYVNEKRVVYDATLNQTNITNNNNKFYRIQILQSEASQRVTFNTHTRWGRVGELGQSKIMGPYSLAEAICDYEQKFKDKTGHSWDSRTEPPKKGKYTFVQKIYEDPPAASGNKSKEFLAVRKTKKESKLPIETQRLMELIFNETYFHETLREMGYNNEKLPLGNLSKSTIAQGFSLLQELAEVIENPDTVVDLSYASYQEAIEDLSNQYYSTIPHFFGRKRAPRISNDEMIRDESEMLDSLSAMEIADRIMELSEKNDSQGLSLLDKRFEQLRLEELVLLKDNSKEFLALQEYLVNTSGKTHSMKYELQDVFRVTRDGESARFITSGFAARTNTCRRLLWHGSRTTNFGGILSQGLRIAPPEAPASGYMFGKGIYLADISTKSANYCFSEHSDGIGLLLLCEAELGNPVQELVRAAHDASETAKEAGCISTFGIGKITPQGWVDAGLKLGNDELKGVLMPDVSQKPGDQQGVKTGWLQYNEYICYDVAQVRIRYLLRAKISPAAS